MSDPDVLEIYDPILDFVILRYFFFYSHTYTHTHTHTKFYFDKFIKKFMQLIFP